MRRRDFCVGGSGFESGSTSSRTCAYEAPGGPFQDLLGLC
jgi:hypothetical protein